MTLILIAFCVTLCQCISCTLLGVVTVYESFTLQGRQRSSNGIVEESVGNLLRQSLLSLSSTVKGRQQKTHTHTNVLFLLEMSLSVRLELQMDNVVHADVLAFVNLCPNFLAVHLNFLLQKLQLFSFYKLMNRKQNE